MAYYAPQGDFSLAARFTRPPAETEVISNVLLVLEDRGLSARGLFLLAPRVEKLFSAGFLGAGRLARHQRDRSRTESRSGFERDGAARPGRADSRRACRKGCRRGRTAASLFQATSTPAGWLARSTAGQAESRSGPSRPPTAGPRRTATTQVAFPVFAVAGATRDVGAVAVDARGDLVVRPEALKQLTPLDEKEKASYGLGGVATSLAYRYESQPYQAAFSVERTPPRLTARTFSFLRVEPDALIGHYEIIYRVDEARTRKLSLSAPREHAGGASHQRHGRPAR